MGGGAGMPCCRCRQGTRKSREKEFLSFLVCVVCFLSLFCPLRDLDLERALRGIKRETKTSIVTHVTAVPALEPLAMLSMRAWFDKKRASAWTGRVDKEKLKLLATTSLPPSWHWIVKFGLAVTHSGATTTKLLSKSGEKEGEADSESRRSCCAWIVCLCTHAEVPCADPVF